MVFFEKWVENDYNPFVLFDKCGKILYLNKEAQFLISNDFRKELFDVALSFASENFGFKTIHLELDFNHVEFFAITIGYESENEIGVKLYKKPIKKIEPENIHTKELSNIYLLIDLAISTSGIYADFIKKFDPTIPDFYILVGELLKVLSKIYKMLFGKSRRISTTLYIKTGEYIKIEGKKYSIARLEIFGDCFDSSKKKDIETLSSQSGISINIQQEKVFLDLPIIFKKEEL